MVDQTDKDTKHIKDQSRDTGGYLEYTNEKEKGKVNQFDVENKTTNTTVVVTNQGQVKTVRTETNDQKLQQVIIIKAH